MDNNLFTTIINLTPLIIIININIIIWPCNGQVNCPGCAPHSPGMGWAAALFEYLSYDICCLKKQNNFLFTPNKCNSDFCNAFPSAYA